MIEALITGAVALIVCMINNVVQGRALREQSEAQNNKTISLIDYKLEELTKRVNEHNGLVERTYHLEELVSLQEEKIKVANHRIEDLEKGRE